jgi:hypothetical protein
MEPAPRKSAGSPQKPRPTSALSQAMKNDMVLAIMAQQPIEPSALDSSSIARNTVSGASSEPPIERGRYICKSPAFARAFAISGGTCRMRSPSSRAARMSGARFLAAVTTSTGRFGLAS